MEIRELRDADTKEYMRIWQECFGDSEEVIRDFLGYFDESLHCYVLEDAGRVRAALTQFSMGTLVFGQEWQSRGVPEFPETELLVSYAIGTEEASRGRGYGAAITEFAKQQARSSGKGSVLCPAEPGLVDFYSGLKYLPLFWMEERMLQATVDNPEGRAAENLEGRSEELCRASATGRTFRAVSASEYGSLREDFLQNRMHIRLSEAVLRCAEDAGPEEGAFWISEDEEILFAVEEDSRVEADGGEKCDGICEGDGVVGQYRLLEAFRRDGAVPTEADLREILAWSGRSSMRVRIPVTEDRKPAKELRWKETLYVQALAVLPKEVRIPGAFTDTEENRRAWLESGQAKGPMAMPWFGFPFE